MIELEIIHLCSILMPSCKFIFDTICLTNNVILPGRCISAVIAGSEFVRLEREYQHRQSLTNGHAEGMDPELASHTSAEASIKSTLQLFVKFSAEIILDSWSETQR